MQIILGYSIKISNILKLQSNNLSQTKHRYKQFSYNFYKQKYSLTSARSSQTKHYGINVKPRVIVYQTCPDIKVCHSCNTGTDADG